MAKETLLDRMKREGDLIPLTDQQVEDLSDACVSMQTLIESFPSDHRIHPTVQTFAAIAFYMHEFACYAGTPEEEEEDI